MQNSQQSAHSGARRLALASACVIAVIMFVGFAKNFYLRALPPAFGRFVAYLTHRHVDIIVLALMTASGLLCMCIDTVRHRRLHPAFAWGGSLVLASDLLTYLAQITAEAA
jgi:hypothetical protein